MVLKNKIFQEIDKFGLNKEMEFEMIIKIKEITKFLLYLFQYIEEILDIDKEVEHQ